MGITGVSLRNYTLGGFGMIPANIIYVYFGTMLSNISDVVSGNFNGGSLQLGLLIGGSVFGFFAIVYVSYVAKKEVTKTLKAIAEEEERKKREEENKKVQSKEEQNPEIRDEGHIGNAAGHAGLEVENVQESVEEHNEEE